MSKKEKSSNVYRPGNTSIVVGCIILAILVTVILVSTNMLMKNKKNGVTTNSTAENSVNTSIDSGTVPSSDLKTDILTEPIAPSTHGWIDPSTTPVVTSVVQNPITTGKDVPFNPELTTTARKYTNEPKTSDTKTVAAEKITKGSLVLIDSSHQFVLANKLTRAEMATLSASTLEDRYGFSVVNASKFFKRKINQFLDIDANTEFVNMLNSFASVTGRTDVQLRNAYYYDSSETVCYNVSGLYVDLEILSDDDGKLYPLNHNTKREVYYDWFIENSWKFGFIHVGQGKSSTGQDQYSSFRYVGIPHATYMHQNNMSLSDYLNFLKGHGMDKILTITDPWGVSWLVYYVKATGQSTNVTVYGTEKCYRISGNSDDGFIVTINTAYFQ